MCRTTPDHLRTRDRPRLLSNSDVIHTSLCVESDVLLQAKLEIRQTRQGAELLGKACVLDMFSSGDVSVLQEKKKRGAELWEKVFVPVNCEAEGIVRDAKPDVISDVRRVLQEGDFVVGHEPCEVAIKKSRLMYRGKNRS